MNEYIEKSAIVSKCEEMWNNADETTQTGVDTINTLDRITDYIESLPTADVQPIRRGRWIPQGDDMWLCSNCKENIIFSMHESDRTEKQRYCCKCGARMDGDTNDRVWTRIYRRSKKQGNGRAYTCNHENGRRT